jgi:hypothetical protein
LLALQDAPWRESFRAVRDGRKGIIRESHDRPRVRKDERLYVAIKMPRRPIAGNPTPAFSIHSNHWRRRERRQRRARRPRAGLRFLRGLLFKLQFDSAAGGLSLDGLAVALAQREQAAAKSRSSRAGQALLRTMQAPFGGD